MARTRGASNAWIVGEAELLDKDGKPIPVVAHEAMPGLEGHVIDQEPPEPTPPPAPLRFRCDASTCQRDMDGFELIRILNLLTGTPLSVEVGEEEFGALHADVRRHFRRV